MDFSKCVLGDFVLFIPKHLGASWDLNKALFEAQNLSTEISAPLEGLTVRRSTVSLHAGVLYEVPLIGDFLWFCACSMWLVAAHCGQFCGTWVSSRFLDRDEPLWVWSRASSSLCQHVCLFRRTYLKLLSDFKTWVTTTCSWAISRSAGDSREPDSPAGSGNQQLNYWSLLGSSQLILTPRPGLYTFGDHFWLQDCFCLRGEGKCTLVAPFSQILVARPIHIYTHKNIHIHMYIYIHTYIYIYIYLGGQCTFVAPFSQSQHCSLTGYPTPSFSFMRESH